MKVAAVRLSAFSARGVFSSQRALAASARYGNQHDHQHDDGAGDEDAVVGRGQCVQVDQRRGQRQIEDHRLRVAERHGEPGEEARQQPALALLRLDRLRRDACRPEGVGEPGEVGDTEPFDGEEDHAEGLRDEGEAEHDGGQIGQVAEHQPERHEQRRAEARAERASHQRSDARAGNGRGNARARRYR